MVGIYTAAALLFGSAPIDLDVGNVLFLEECAFDGNHFLGCWICNACSIEAHKILSQLPFWRPPETAPLPAQAYPQSADPKQVHGTLIERKRQARGV